ncbi:hypothetical protein OEZ86_005331 [Tetradesmus obliquus]|nr:hypothetical protein OEZ86_005331 [Tetradesmus obliquus]
MWAYAALPGKLPPGTYKIELPEAAGTAVADKALLGWLLGCYKFSRYKTGKVGNGQQQAPSSEEEKPMLLAPQGADIAAVLPMAEAFFWCRDMINTPAEDMGPQDLAAEAAALAAAHIGASLQIIEGDDLLAANYPAVHTVGRAAARPPALIDLSWRHSSSSSSSSRGDAEAADASSATAAQPAAAADGLPLVALVGKGVCFDTGGLDLKTAQGMKLMKKDMGGAALMLALCHVIFSAQLPVRLRVLLPAVENAVSGSSYRPGDVLQTRAGITVENGNTDAEGRLILADAIYEAACFKPDILIDAATLTGAARVALGPEVPVVFSNSDDTWAQLEAAAKQEADPMWRLPLWPGYRKQLDSKVADLSSTGEPGQAGAITAALFLQEFAKAAPAWVHIDTAGWVAGGSSGPGRPEGGEALGLRVLWRFLQDRYGGLSE